MRAMSDTLKGGAGRPYDRGTMHMELSHKPSSSLPGDGRVGPQQQQRVPDLLIVGRLHRPNTRPGLADGSHLGPPIFLNLLTLTRPHASVQAP
jgi:hypothetical protein